MNYLQFAGNHATPIIPNDAGMYSFGTWINGPGVYEASTTITIDTPNYPDINGQPLNGAPASIWCGGNTNSTRAFAAYATGNTSQDFLSIGMVDADLYQSIHGQNWSPFADEWGGWYSTDGLTNSALPGDARPDGQYTLIFLSTLYRGQSSAGRTATRVIYKAQPGTLGEVATRLVTTGGSGGGIAALNWTITAASDDESAAGSLMANGYGLLLDYAPIFAQVINQE